jgi:ABC-type amino acid transport substrate-binding protein
MRLFVAGIPARHWRTASLCLLQAGIWLGSACGIAQAEAGPPDSAVKQLRFAPEKDYPPFIFEDDNGEIHGLSADMLRAIAPALDLDLKILPAAPLADILAAARAGKVDLISSLRPNAERRAFLNFSSPYALVPAVLVVHAGDSRSQAGDFKTGRVAVGKGYAVESFLRQNHPALELFPVADDTQGMRLLHAGKVDALVADLASVHYLMRALRIDSLQIASSVGFEYQLCFAWRRELGDAGKQIENAIKQMDGDEHQRILNRWLTQNASGFSDSRVQMVHKAGWLMLLLLAGVVLLGWYRRRTAAAGPEES